MRADDRDQSRVKPCGHHCGTHAPLCCLCAVTHNDLIGVFCSLCLKRHDGEGFSLFTFQEIALVLTCGTLGLALVAYLTLT